MRVQIALMQKGYDVGAVDGVLGSKTREALKAFQKANQQTVTGTMTSETLSALGLLVPRQP